MNLPATVYCNAYWSLLFVLYQSSWPLSLQINLLSSQCSVQDLQRLLSSSKPFPGVWTCRVGVVLWRPAFSEDTARTFHLSETRNTNFKNLTKAYWHQAALTNSYDHHRFGLLEAGRRRDRTVFGSRLLRLHARLIECLNVDEKIRPIAKSRCSPSFTKNATASRNSEELQLAVDCGRASNIVDNLAKATSDGMKWLMNRVTSYMEPCLEKGKVRVKWQCVSTLIHKLLVTTKFGRLTLCRRDAVAVCMMTS